MSLKILTFNHYESFLVALAKTGFDFDVIEKKGRLDLAWNPASPPRPQNIRAVAFESTIKNRLKTGYYDVIICHSIKNLIWMMPYKKNRYIFVAHIHLFRKTFRDKLRAFWKQTIYRIFSASRQCSLVAVTRNKVHSWNQGGDVVVNVPFLPPPTKAISEKPFPDQGSEQIQVHPVIFVSNRMRQRGDEAGYEVIRFLSANLPLTVIGNNPGFPGAVIPEGYEQFRSAFNKGKVYVFPVRPPYDEFNLAMLEAMSLGLPVVCFQHPLSPVIHNVNGLIASSREQMLRHLKFLVENPRECERLGKAARRTIREHFSESVFLSQWRSILKKQTGRLLG